MLKLIIFIFFLLVTGTLGTINFYLPLSIRKLFLLRFASDRTFLFFVGFQVIHTKKLTEKALEKGQKGTFHNSDGKMIEKKIIKIARLFVSRLRIDK